MTRAVNRATVTKLHNGFRPMTCLHRSHLGSLTTWGFAMAVLCASPARADWVTNSPTDGEVALNIYLVGTAFLLLPYLSWLFVSALRRQGKLEEGTPYPPLKRSLAQSIGAIAIGFLWINCLKGAGWRSSEMFAPLLPSGIALIFAVAITKLSFRKWGTIPVYVMLILALPILGVYGSKVIPTVSQFWMKKLGQR